MAEAPSAHLAAVIQDLVPRVIGKDPLDIADIENVCIPPWQIVQNTDDNSSVTAFGGLEIALWDLRGKIWDQPLDPRGSTTGNRNRAGNSGNAGTGRHDPAGL